MQNVDLNNIVADIDIEQLQEKIDAGILLAQQRLKEKCIRENGQLVVMRDGEVKHITAEDIEKME
jgi:hypothetical protein